MDGESEKERKGRAYDELASLVGLSSPGYSMQ
jgi:hypothetical protein